LAPALAKRGLKTGLSRIELVAATGVAEADHMAIPKRQAIGLHRLARPGAGVIDRIGQLKVGFGLGHCGHGGL
jgi:hypothetical protein